MREQPNVTSWKKLLSRRKIKLCNNRNREMNELKEKERKERLPL